MDAHYHLRLRSGDEFTLPMRSFAGRIMISDPAESQVTSFLYPLDNDLWLHHHCPADGGEDRVDPIDPASVAELLARAGVPIPAALEPHLGNHVFRCQCGPPPRKRTAVTNPPTEEGDRPEARGPGAERTRIVPPPHPRDCGFPRFQRTLGYALPFTGPNEEPPAPRLIDHTRLDRTTKLLGRRAWRKRKLIEFLATQDGCIATLEDIASKVYRRRTIDDRSLKSARRQAERTRATLAKKVCPLRLEISDSAVRLVDATSATGS
jgi:hypothetical protein